MRQNVVIENETMYPDGEVSRLIRFAISELNWPSARPVYVTVTYTRVSDRRRLAGGRYLYGATGWAHRGGHEVLLRVSHRGDFPCYWYDRRSGVTPIGELADWREALIAIAAHEGAHIESVQCGMRRRHTKSEEEGRADAFAEWTLRRYRARGGAERTRMAIS